MGNINDIMRLINEGKPRQKIQASFSLTKENDFSMMPFLMEELENEDWELKSDASYYLGKVGWKPALEKIGHMVIKEKMYEVKNVAIFSLQSMGFKEVIPFILMGLRDENFEIREDSRMALFRILGKVILPLINPNDEEMIEEDEERIQEYNRNAQEIEEWWRNHRNTFEDQKSYFFGKLVTPSIIFEKLKEEPVENDDYLIQLEDMTGQSFGRPSNKMLESWDFWIKQNQVNFRPGNKYFYGYDLISNF